MADRLRAAGVTDVVVGGLATDYCVAFTALDAKREGFGVTFVPDASRGIAAESVDAQLAAMRAAGILFKTTAELLAQKST